MVIDNKPRDKKNIHPVVINNHTLPYTEKCKINNNLTDDDDIARQKRCMYAQANALARNFTYATIPLKQLYLIHTVVQCTKTKSERYYCRL